MGKHGFGTLVRKDENSPWMVRFVVRDKDGKSRKKSKSTGERDYDKAVKAAERITAPYRALSTETALSAQLKDARDHAKALDAKNKSLSLLQLESAFLSSDQIRRRKLSKARLRDISNIIDHLIDAFGAKRELRNITRAEAVAYMRRYEGQVGGRRFNCCLDLYKRIWKHFLTHDEATDAHPKARLSENVWDSIDRVYVSETESKKPFTTEELSAIWRVLREDGDEEMQLLWDLARWTGARLHDIVSFTYDNVIVGGPDEMFLKWKPVKTRRKNKLVELPIVHPPLRETIRLRMSRRDVGEEHLLPRLWDLYENHSASRVSKMVQDVITRAGIETVKEVDGYSRKACIHGLHSCRHSLVSELYSKGVDLATLQHEFMLHGSIYTTEIYASGQRELKKDILSKLKPVDARSTTEILQGLGQEVDEEARRTNEEVDRILADTGLGPQTSVAILNLVNVKSIDDLLKIRDWLDRRISTFTR